MTPSFSANPTAVSGIRELVRDAGTGAGLEFAAVEDLVLAVTEACANVIRHTSSSHIRISVRTTSRSMTVEVSDRGIFRAPKRSDDWSEGFGIDLMRALVDDVTIEAGTPVRPGTLVRLTKNG